MKLAPLRLTQPTPNTKQTEAFSNNKALMLISPILIDKEIAKGSTVIAFIPREINDDSLAISAMTVDPLAISLSISLELINVNAFLLLDVSVYLLSGVS